MEHFERISAKKISLLINPNGAKCTQMYFLFINFLKLDGFMQEFFFCSPAFEHA